MNYIGLPTKVSVVFYTRPDFDTNLKSTQLKQLRNAGFINEERNSLILRQVSGDVHQAIAVLLEEQDDAMDGIIYQEVIVLKNMVQIGKK